MMVDADILDDITGYSYKDILVDSHWVVYEGNLQFFDKDGFDICDIKNAVDVGFRVYTWGYNPKNGQDESKDFSTYRLLTNRKISVESFKSNFYGYIETN